MGIYGTLDDGEGKVMAYVDYCPCKVCKRKSFYDANMDFEDVVVGAEWLQLPIRCGDYAGLCIGCAKEYRLEAVKRDEPVDITLKANQ